MSEQTQIQALTAEVKSQVAQSANKAVSTVKNTFIGGTLVFLSNLPRFFDPILFVFANLGILSRAALHTLAPVLISWLAIQNSPVFNETFLSSNLYTIKFIGLFSLYTMSAFTWMTSLMLLSSFYKGLATILRGFERIGAEQTAKNV